MEQSGYKKEDQIRGLQAPQGRNSNWREMAEKVLLSHGNSDKQGHEACGVCPHSLGNEKRQPMLILPQEVTTENCPWGCGLLQCDEL